MNPGSPTPQAGILNHSSHTTPSIPNGCDKEAIRRPQPENIKYKDEIIKTITKAKEEGKAENTINSFSHRLKQLSKVADLLKPEEVKTAIAYSRLANSSKSRFCLAYEWFTKANGSTWQKPKYKWNLPTPIKPHALRMIFVTTCPCGIMRCYRVYKRAKSN